MSDEKHPERAQRRARLAGLAAQQWGNVTARQLAALDISRCGVAGMARRGEILRAHRGVYALGHRSPAPEAGRRRCSPRGRGVR